MASIGIAAQASGVQVVAGDTKVLPHGEGSGVYFATAGIGIRPDGVDLGMGRIRAGDRILASGPVGDHGVCVMLAHEAFGLRGDLHSDAASVLPLTRAIRALPGVHFMRDPTRGGLATVCHEIAHACSRRIVLQGPDIPVHDPVQSVCEMLGYDPLFLACEGRVVAVVSPDSADEVLARWRALPGGRRILEELQDDPLPRIC